MNKKMHSNILSNTTKRKINNSKYNKVELTKEKVDINKLYDMRRDGWRKK